MKSKFLLALFLACAVVMGRAIAEDAKPAAKPAEKKEAKKEEKKEEKKAPASDGELIKENTTLLIEAFQAKDKDIDKIMSYYSDKFASDKITDKDGMRALLDMANNSGFLDGISLDTKEMKITVEGEKATVGPIAISGGFGSGSSVFTLTKEDGHWKITSQTLDGIEI